MNSHQVRALLNEALITLEAARDELRDLDAAIGDGDLGVTVTEGSRAIRRDLAALDKDASLADVLRQAAKSFANANPSTMAALVATGLLAGARAISETADLDQRACAEMLDAATSAIQARGGAELGDKTLLDALAPTLDVLRNSDAEPAFVLKQMVASAQEAVESTKALRSKRGRAAWVGERSIGQPDGGATAYLRLLQALERAWEPAIEVAASHEYRTIAGKDS